jgi:transposase
VLHQDPFTGHMFVFRGRTRANLIKIIYCDGTGLWLFTKRLEHGVFLWPPSVEPGETLSLTSAQLSSLINGVDWRAPEQHQICARLRIFHEPYNRDDLITAERAHQFHSADGPRGIVIPAPILTRDRAWLIGIGRSQAGIERKALVIR